MAAGALEHLPVARVVNLNRSLEALKEEGYRVVGLAAEGTVSLEEADLSGPLVVVTGSEGDGLSMLTRRNCDQLVRIPLRGSTPSLNASVATALLLYEIARRGWMHGITGTAPAPRLVRPSLPTPEPMPMEEEVPGAEQPPEAAVVVAEPAWEPVESQVESQPEPQPEPEPEPEPEHGPEPVAESESEAATEAAAPEPSELPAEATEAGTPVDSAPPMSSAEEALDLSPWAAAVAGADAFESDIRL